METFMVRIWRPGGDERAEGLRGTARHVRSGSTTTFTDAQQLTRFLVETIAAGSVELPVDSRSWEAAE